MVNKDDILVINPGSTSTKIAVFRGEEPVLEENVFHNVDEINSFPDIASQRDYRYEYIMSQLKKDGYDMNQLKAVVGRGGMVIDLEGGGYRVTDQLCSAMESKLIPPHACSLGALLSYDIGETLGIPAFIYDSPMGCELLDVATITGLKDIKKYGCCHVLNTRAQAMKYADRIGVPYKDLNLIVCHMGGGITTNAQSGGRIIDTATYDDGPMAPERSGGLPLILFYNMIFDRGLTREEVSEKVSGKGGLYSYLGTKDCIEIENRIMDGDEEARIVYEAMAYQVAKSIADMSVPLKGKVDAIIMTGGIARSEYLCSMIEEYAGHIGQFVMMPGENEMEALALGAERMMEGREEAKEYHGRYSRDDK